MPDFSLRPAGTDNPEAVHHYAEGLHMIGVDGRPDGRPPPKRSDRYFERSHPIETLGSRDMSNDLPRAGAAGAVVLSAATGVATNLLTDQPSWAAGAAVVVLVVAGAALAITSRKLEQQGGTPSPGPPAAAPAGYSQYAQVSGGRSAQAGRDVNSGMPAGYVVLCLLVVAFMAIGVLLVAVKFAPASGTSAGNAESAGSTAGSILTRVVGRGTSSECAGQDYFLPVDGTVLKSSMPRTMTSEDANKYTPRFAQWVARHHGWRAVSWLRFTVQSRSESAVILTSLSINTVGEQPSTSKSLVTTADGCGSNTSPRTFDVDLTRRPPRLKAVAGTDENGKTIPAVKFPFKVSSTDPEIFDLTVTAGPARETRWTATLAYTQDGRGYETTIDDNGQPFRSVGWSDVPTYGLSENGTLTER